MLARGKNLYEWTALSLATGGFSGYLPKAPGTYGSLVAVLLLYFLGQRTTPISLAAYLTLSLSVLLVGVWACYVAGRIFKIVDAPYIVIDEIAGILVTMIGIPLTSYWLVIGFLLFRLFDIAKPPPARFFDTRVKNGWGVMLDDVVAGGYANLILHLMIRAQI